MAVECTLCIIKPNAVSKNIIGSIFYRIENAGLKIIAMKMCLLTLKEAQNFYFEHRYKDFFYDLIHFMSSNPIVLSVLKSNNAIKRLRNLMGATNPNKAISGTVRFDYGDNITENAIHGSDSLLSANKEIDYFFKQNEIF
ncbi:MAG: nucleoside-diphosphate kinase [Candidatus Dasytiphilus stammeri]